MNTNRILPLANDFIKVIESPDPKNIYCYSPGITILENGRLIATMDMGGPGVQNDPYLSVNCGKAFYSDDKGKTWVHTTDFPFCHARPFTAGKALYILGQSDDLAVIRSDDDGITWSKPAKLTEGQKWGQAPCNVHYWKGCIYIVMERNVYDDIKGWPVGAQAPVLMRGRVDSDLTKRENWTFASEIVFRDIVNEDELDYFGVPFYKTEPKADYYPAPGRACAPMGWLETNIVRITDPDHYWFDPEYRTIHLWMRAHTGSAGYAAVAKVVENPDGTMTTMLETVPSGKKVLFVPCPGGQMKFHILYDEVTKLYWLLSTQATDSMTRAERLDSERYNLPNNERQRLQLHFSKNCIDWCFAGLVATGPSQKQARSYASMVIDGEDLHVLSRSGDEKAASAHNGNFISFHTIKNFRDLVY